MSTEVLPFGITLAKLRDALDVSPGVVRGMVTRGYLSRRERPHRGINGNHSSTMGFYMVTEYGAKALEEVRATERAVAGRKDDAARDGNTPAPEAKPLNVDVEMRAGDLVRALEKVTAAIDKLQARVTELEQAARTAAGG